MRFPYLGWTLLLLLLAGCGERADVKVSELPASTAAGPPVTGDWLLIHSLSDPEQLNPLTSNDAAASSILQYIFQSLLTRDPRDLELKPLLAAARPEISPDKLTYTFRLRRDAHFQDGRPVTGADVLFSIKAIKHPLVNAPFRRVYFNSVTDVRLIDEFTVQFEIHEPYFLNENVLGGIDVLPRHYYDSDNLLKDVTVADLAGDPERLSESAKKFAEQFNRSFSRNPMGSGPYKFAGWKTGREVTLERDPDYWGYGKEGIDQPFVDRHRYRIINNMDAALVTLKSGSLDTMSLTPIQHVRGTGGERFEREFQKHEYFSPSYSYIGWNNSHPIFRDPRTRKAMTYLTHREQMVKSILFGLGEVVEGPIYFFRPEYDKTVPSHPYDPKRALELLREAGWSDSDGDGILDKMIDGRRVPFRFELKINSGNTTRKSVALTLQDELRRHGIAMSVREIDWTIFLGDVKARRFDAIILGWAMSVGEPDAYQVWHSSQIANQGSNHIGYKNARVDEILEAYRREFDAEKRIELYREFQRILSDEQPYTFLFIGKSVVATHRRIQGVEVLPGGIYPMEWWVPADAQRFGQQLTPH